MKIAVNVSPLYRVDGGPMPMTGVHQYLESLTGALLAAHTPHTIRAFAPLAAPWHSPWASNRMDTPGSRWGTVTEEIALLRRGLRSARLRLALAETRRAGQGYDLMHFGGPSYLPAARIKPSYCVATVFDVSTRLHPETHTAENIRTWETYFAFVEAQADRIITISEFAQREIVASLNVDAGRIDVTPLAPRHTTRRITNETERAALIKPLGLNSDRPFVLYAGTLEPRKNLETLLRAFALINDKEARLVLAGGARGDYETTLRALAHELGITDRLVWTGYVDNEIMNALLSACTVFAFLSHHEGFGMPPLEAMVCGAPVVVSDAASLPEVVGEAGIRVPPDSSEQAACALTLLLTDAAENARQRVLSLRQAARFSWERTAALTLQTYEKAVL